METTGQKHISTVADDIKKLIADISNGKPAPITEENMNDFLNNVKEAMIAWNTPPKKEKYDGSLRMSILGKPARQLWYDKNSPKETKEYDASNNLKFLYGHIIEHLILYLAEKFPSLEFELYGQNYNKIRSYPLTFFNLVLSIHSDPFSIVTLFSKFNMKE